MPKAHDYVDTIRAELEKLVCAGRITSYRDLGAVIGKPARWTLWNEVLDTISFNRPDITIVVLNAKTGWPGQIDYKATDGKPSITQQQFAQGELAEVFARYCPGKSVPKLPIKRIR
jgi:hypothetical protein